MRLLFLMLFISGGIAGLSQSPNDTITILYDYKWEAITSGQPTYLGRAWKEGNKWHKQDYYYIEKSLEMDGVYADKNYDIKDGSFTWFNYKGRMIDSCFYINGLKEGTQITWDEEGNQTSLQHWNQNLPVDTALWWNSKGVITAVQITDSSGNGLYQQYLEDGKTIKIQGRLASGKRTGKWFFKDSRGILGTEIMYQADSAISAQCYNEKGEPEPGKKECILEQPAKFKDGAEGWKLFLEENLKYPKYAQKKDIQGIVKVQFMVSKLGEVSEMKVISSPHESLSNEVLRLMSISPRWVPAKQYNRPVLYRHVQTITFQLQ